MNKVLIILGPTGTGKTELGIFLASQFNGEIVSADSRQVYKEMDIGTGKDLPKSSELRVKNHELGIDKKEFSVGYREKNSIPIWLVDVVSPDYQFNVGEYLQIATAVIGDILSRGKLPIVVGGTGLYIRSLIEPLRAVSIPPNENLRKELENYTVEKLQNKLQRISLKKWASMNNSDRYNPRRLVRAIEVELSGHQSQQEEKASPSMGNSANSVLLIGLTANTEILKSRIQKRIERRLSEGILDEIKDLLDKGYSFNLPSFSACGYGIWEDYFNSKNKNDNKKKFVKTIQNWILEEFQYAKRQKTFFKKIKNIQWFDIAHESYFSFILEKIKQWYNK